MDTKTQKRNIIIKEILFWKQNKMLPEQYCDYLLALYNQGENPDISDRERSKFPFMGFLTASLIFALIPFSLFVIYFTELSFVLQTAILAGFVVLLIFAGIYYSNKEMLLPLIYITAALVTLIYSVHITGVFFNGSTNITYAVLFMNCFAWLVSGVYLKYWYFTAAAILGGFILMVSIVI
ncbi:hypothetical protein D3H55_03075 [Bacillus salacetis]|uniref:Uncharacterized protein n=1 Tax=Bacillus salacetis TaxID=2315464 RepID=A0A3A1R7T8_9BACI|nr:hypothetical protein [Bacillus salacetis]RIW37571.1 hypothetical protein D3H55_03075 [Bacillus salacetis]